MRIEKTAEEIGHKPSNPIVKMLLLSPHDHTFWYEREDGTRYMAHRRRKLQEDYFYTEVDGYQLELKMSQQSTGLGAAHPVPYAPAPPETVDLQDTSPSDIQPPGVDEDEPQSLEEALLGE